MPSLPPIDVAERGGVASCKERLLCGNYGRRRGIPVYAEGNRLIGVPAVIDKDFASELVAEIT